MKNSKRILSLILALILVLACLPISALAADENPTSGTCGENLTWVLSDDGTLTISGTGAMYDYRSGGAPWFSGIGNIQSVVIEPGVTSIGNYAFFACYAMTGVTIPATVTSIGNYAFANCESMTELTIPEGVETIGDYAFENWRNMTELTISNTVTTIGEYAFEYCKGLTSVVIPNSVTSLGEAVFYCCSGLTEAVLPNGMTEIPGWMFYNCALTGVTIPDSVTSIGNYAFCGCSLTQVTVPESVTIIGGSAFARNNSLTNLTINNPNCTILDGFEKGDTCGVPTVTVIHGHAGSTAQKYAEKYGYQFESSGTCGENLTWTLAVDGTLTISGTGEMTNYELYTAPWSPARGRITTVEVQLGVTSIGDYAFSSLADVVDVAIPNSVTRIGDYALESCHGLTSVTIPNSVTTIGAFAFGDCLELSSVTIPSSVTEIGNGAFSYCQMLQEISVSPSNPNYSCADGILYNKDKTVLHQYPAGKSAETFSIPNSVTTIGNYSFYGCFNLTGITIPNIVTIIGEGAFEHCNGLVGVSIPDSVTTIGKKAFSSCMKLSDVAIPNGVTTIEDSTFANCWSITSITIPAGVTSIGEGAFYMCISLADITIPNGVTVIAPFTFGHCDRLTIATIPDSIVTIDQYAFAWCYRLTSLTINNPECEIYPENITCGNPEVTVIYGHPGSTAQAYAEKWGYQFKTIGAAVNPFTDVKESAWYYKAVLWAAGNGITGGVGDGKFAPNASCTRAQVVTFLWNAAGKPEPKSTTNPFSDVKETDYFYKAVLWAVENGVTSGTGNGKFGAKDVCTRGQVVAFMWNAAGKPEPKTTTNSFSDVKETDYYYKAVLWAVENGVTSGTGNGQFSPKAQCTRAQVVTFLYSYYG